MARIDQIRVGMIGAGQIARAHVMAFNSVPMLHKMMGFKFKLAILAEATDVLAGQASDALGFEASTSNWKHLTGSDDVDLVDIVTPTYLHAEQAIDAAEHHKHILCEKPLATSAEDAKRMLDAATRSGIIHTVGFNYRRLSSVTFAKDLVQSGQLGKVYRFRVAFLEDWGANPQMNHTWRYAKATAGGGALADLGSHALDLARFVLGDEIVAVCGLQKTFVFERKMTNSTESQRAVDVDDSTLALLRFRSGVIGTMESSWSALGRKALLEFEVNGSEGSVYFSLERPNELMIYSSGDAKDRLGYKTVLMGPLHPYGGAMVFPSQAMGLGYGESLVNEVYELLKSISAGEKDQDKKISATFFDGWKVNQLIEAIQASSSSNAWVSI